MVLLDTNLAEDPASTRPAEPAWRDTGDQENTTPPPRRKIDPWQQACGRPGGAWRTGAFATRRHGGRLTHPRSWGARGGHGLWQVNAGRRRRA